MYRIVIQSTVDKTIYPAASLLRKWAKAALKAHRDSAEVTIRIIDQDEMTTLNSTYRGKAKPTNVLSFPFEMPEGIELDMPILGDLAICADVVNSEAQEQGKTAESHWAHMIIHGIFHLLGYDHETDSEAEEMEALEIQLMQRLNFANPYESGEHINDHE